MSVLTDTQSERDERNIAINRAGVSALRYPVTIRREDGTTFPTIAEACLTVNVAANQRGTHMSRFVEELHAAHTEMTPAGVVALARHVRARLKATNADIDLRMTWFRLKKAPITGGEAWMAYDVRWQASVMGRTAELQTTVKVPVGTLCPCSKAISDRGAHNQRGFVTVTVKSAPSLWPETLIELVEKSASCDLYSLLKRPDEKFVTERAYDSPVFVEDLVRNIAVQLRRHKTVTAYRIEAENMESIHNHNATAVIVHKL